MLRTFLSSHTSSNLLGDWSRILEDLTKQGEKALAGELRSRFDISVDEIVSRARALGSSPEQEWAILVGAGGSQPEPSSIPTVGELLPVLWDKAAAINARALLRLQSRCDELAITNIEDLLSALAVAQATASNSKVTSLLGHLLFRTDQQRSAERSSRPFPQRRLDQRTGAADAELVDGLNESSQSLFALLVGMMKDKPSNPIHGAIAERVNGRGDTIITTNYDACIERALSGDGYDYRLDPAAPPSTSVPLIKLHGSLSWYACRSCDRYVTASLNQIADAGRAGLYPVTAMCPDCEAVSQQLIVPPIALKFAEHPVLLHLRKQAEEALARAKLVAVVGYSFSEADAYILRMMSRAVAQAIGKIVVVFDTNREPSTRLRSFISAHVAQFDVNENILAATGPAEKLFPEFVSAMSNASKVVQGTDRPVEPAQVV